MNSLKLGYLINVEPVGEVKKFGLLAHVSDETRKAIFNSPSGHFKEHTAYIKKKLAELKKEAARRKREQSKAERGMML